jgi:DNA-binding CsgD family transcriptional regulator
MAFALAASPPHPSQAERFFADLPVHTAMLDEFGVIVAVNDQWKRFAEASGLNCPHGGVGENYLRHCAFADPQSPHLVRELSRLLAGEIDMFSHVYPCHSPNERRWFILLGFPHISDGCRIALMHVDVTAIVSSMSRATALAGPHKADGDLADDEVCAASATRIAALFEKSMASAMSAARGLAHDGRERGRQRGGYQTPLSRRQQDVLALIAEGLTNGEIARRLGLSENTVKIHVSGIFSRLGLESRAQVVHWALTRERGHDGVSAFPRYRHIGIASPKDK